MMAAKDARTMHVGRARARAHTHTRTHAHTRARTRTHAPTRTHTHPPTHTHRQIAPCVVHPAPHRAAPCRILLPHHRFLLLLLSSARPPRFQCDYYHTPVAGVPWESLAKCDDASLRSVKMLTSSCERLCVKRLEPLDPGGPIHYFLLDAVCIGIFTLEFLLRMMAAPVTVGMTSFLTSPANIIDVIAILPFYIDLAVFLALSGTSEGTGANVLRVLRIIRLSRVFRVLKFSKSLSGVMVLFRTVAKSLPAMALIAAFSIFMCILWASIMMVTQDAGTFTPDYQLNPNGLQGQYLRTDGSVSYFADIFEGWWWCLQTLTSLGYGVPWAPVTDEGKGISILAALAGTVVLALPIAVVGVTFDDEWVKQAKVNGE
jgi:hypothetical protein